MPYSLIEVYELMKRSLHDQRKLRRKIEKKKDFAKRMFSVNNYRANR